MPPKPVYDFIPGLPPVTNDAVEAAVESVRAGGVEAAVWDAHLDARIGQLRSDPGFGQRVREVFDDAGVTLVSPTVMGTDPRLDFAEGVYRDLTRWSARFDLLDWMQRVTSPEQARRVVDDGDVGVILNTQNLGAFTDGDLRAVDELFDAGVRSMQLTYNHQNAIGAGCTEPSGSGLSNHGVAAVERLNDLGAIVDCSHCNRETTLDAVAVSDAPIAFTHTHCGALVNNARAKSDAEIEALADVDGYMGVLVYPTLYDEPTFDTFFEHFEHAVSILGLDNVGVSTDWGMTTPDVPESMRPGLLSYWRAATGMTEDAAEYDALTLDTFEEPFGPFRTYDQRSVIREAFERRGYSRSTIDGVLGENFLDFWERVRAAR
ncbi:MAG: dipeptidase [Haloarculaceae archaeon]